MCGGCVVNRGELMVLFGELKICQLFKIYFLGRGRGRLRRGPCCEWWIRSLRRHWPLTKVARGACLRVAHYFSFTTAVSCQPFLQGSNGGALEGWLDCTEGAYEVPERTGNSKNEMRGVLCFGRMMQFFGRARICQGSKATATQQQIPHSTSLRAGSSGMTTRKARATMTIFLVGCWAACQARGVLGFSERGWEASTMVEMPPRGRKSPTTFAQTGLQALTTSSRIWLTMFSWKMPRLR
jgi:hypothetical protein